MAVVAQRSAAALSALLLLSIAGAAGAQVPEYEYRASRYMPNGESQTFKTLAEAEAYIRTEPATPIGNALLQKNKVQYNGQYGTLFDYRVPDSAFARYVGDFYDGHMSGNATDCDGLKCDTEEEMVAASLRAYPLSGSYTATLRGAYLSPPHTMWGSNGQTAHVVMNAIQYSGGSIPNQREVIATAPATGHQYIYRVNRVDVYECPTLFTATDNSFGEPGRGVWPVICRNGAMGQIVKVAKQYAPSCDALPPDLIPRDGNPCAADTGNKEYRESDFDWEGRSFQRVYNSIAEVPLLSGMSDSWSHPFSDRLMFDNGGYPNLWVRADGYIESTNWVASVGMYRPSSSANMSLRQETDAAVIAAKGVWQLRRPSGESLWFGADGRLRRIEEGARTFSLSYCGGSVLGTEQCPNANYVASVASSSGRSLKFEYTRVAIPVGASGTRYEMRMKRVLADGQLLLEYEYDAAARLTRVRHGGPSGAGRQYLYAEADLLCRDHLGNAIANCNPAHYANNLTGVIDEQGVRVARYTYDDKNRVTSSEHAGGAGRVTLNYTSASNVEVTLPAGAKKTYTFDSAPFKRPLQAVITSVDGGSRTVSAGYANDRVAHSVSGSGARSEFSSSNGLYETSAIEGLTAGGSATPQTRTTQTDWNAAVGLPAERRVYDAGNALVGKQAWTYNARRQVVTASSIDPATSAARVTTLTYCESADVTAGMCPAVGLLKQIDGPRTDVADVTLYTYYPGDHAACAASPSACDYRKGDLWMVSDALGHAVETLRYDGFGRPLSSKDPNGVVTDLEYDPRGWLTAAKVRGADPASEADDRITRFEYKATGLVEKITQADGAFTQYVYDDAQRLVEVRDNVGNKVHYTLDPAGNRLNEDTQDAGGTLRRTLSRVYNQLGQLKTSKDAYQHATAYAYDARGNTDTVTDALGKVSDNDHDPLGRLIRTLQDVGGINAQTLFQHDALDRVTQVTDPKGLHTVYGYNGYGDLASVASPDTGITAYTFDSAGNRKTKTDARGIVSTYSYDALNRLTGVAYPDSSLNIGYVYDSAQSVCTSGETFSEGRLTRVTAQAGVTQYCYDRFGQLVRKVQTSNGVALSLRYAYTPAGRLSSVTYPDGAVASYLRDAQGRVAQVGAKRADGTQEVLLSEASHHPFGSVAGWTYGNGRTMSREVDLNYQPKAIRDPAAGGLSVAFGYDEVNNLTGLTPLVGPAVKLDYDALGRLTHLRDAPSGAAIDSYTYDATGNRLSFSNSAGTQVYTYPSDSHRLSQAGSTGARDYDASGNTTAIGGDGFVYNDAGQLSQFKQGGAVKIAYQYNGTGEQVRKSSGGTERYAIYDEAGHWLGEYDGNGAPIQQAIWLDDLPVGVWSGAAAQQKLHYVEPDHLGTPRAVIDPIRNLAVWAWDIRSEAFGNGTPNQDPDQNGKEFVFNLRYPGQLFDSYTGLNYNYFRYYEPGTGRYTQSDPLGLIEVAFDPKLILALDKLGGLMGDPSTKTSSYSYVGGSPLDYLDPEGLARGRGERGATGGSSGKGTANPYKHCWEDPTDSAFIICKDHQSGKKIRKPKPSDWPTAKFECGEGCQTGAKVVVAAGTGYAIYRCLRFLPSLFPPLWPTIPANVVMP
ncbi:RHS repeat-associated core domain-containing protein [Lysobacter firmicutimachus]|uniref:RHS repeat-associated core domain-containing protein n=1 Tax=Lysobacter firmicutimachus TaxID=1792846 RepID=A0AAU8MVU7_9GAMM